MTDKELEGTWTDVMASVAAMAANLCLALAQREPETISRVGIATLIFFRLNTHIRAFQRLWADGFPVECDMLLRAALEATICIVAAENLGDELVDLLSSDAASGLSRSIRQWRDRNHDGLVKGAEAELRKTFGHRRADGGKHRQIDVHELASRCGVQFMADRHRDLSSISVHVTGVSVMRALDREGRADDELFTRLDQVREMLLTVVVACRSINAMAGGDAASAIEDLRRQVHELGLADR